MSRRSCNPADLLVVVEDCHIRSLPPRERGDRRRAGPLVRPQNDDFHKASGVTLTRPRDWRKTSSTTSLRTLPLKIALIRASVHFLEIPAPRATPVTEREWRTRLPCACSQRASPLLQGARTLHENRAVHLQVAPYLLDELRRPASPISGTAAVGVHAVEPPLLRIGVYK